MKFHSRKIVNLKNADIHLHYANNRGRGSDNVTLTFVTPGTERPAATHGYNNMMDAVLFQTRTSGWRGNVNILNAYIDEYGGIV